MSFSATSLSPISNVGYMEREGIKRGSAMNLQGISTDVNHDIFSKGSGKVNVREPARLSTERRVGLRAYQE